MPFLPRALSVTANTIATSAFLPVVMNCLTPFSTQCVALALGARRDRAGVRADLRLGEAEAAEAARRAPAASGSFSFCASVPNALSGPQTTEFCTLTIVEVAPSPAAISSSATASDT